jgi:predicted TIM-barrel fold metal-dependent hydrolase
MKAYTVPQRPYIDCHNHIGRTIDRVPPVGQNTAMCLARFAETGIRAAISAPTAVGSPLLRGLEDNRHQNDVIARACRDFPGCFPIGLALIEPRFGKVGVEEVERAMSERGMHGIVGHPPIADWCIPFVEAAAAREGLCNLHLHNELMGRIATMFPRARFIVHASAWAVENLARHENCWFEIVQYPDFGVRTPWDLGWVASKVGRERMIFGADLPYYDYRFLQSTIESAPIDDDLKDRIAYKNIVALIQAHRPDWKMPPAPPKAPRIYDPVELWKKNPANEERLAVFA